MSWRWRDRRGVFHRPEEMETTHLHHTFRMIWNNLYPNMSVGDELRLYRFDKRYYSPIYLAQAVEHLGEELFKRNVTPELRRELLDIAESVTDGDCNDDFLYRFSNLVLTKFRRFK